MSVFSTISILVNVTITFLLLSTFSIQKSNIPISSLQMFSEEIGVNASRKRAEANKARRLKLKEQELKNKRPPFSSSSTDPSPVTGKDPTAAGTGKTELDQIIVTTQVKMAADPGKGPVAIVERAELERRRRALESSRHQLAEKVQKHFRRRKNAEKARHEQLDSLRKRLSDLRTVRNLMETKQPGRTFVAPPATCVSLIRQFLFAMVRCTPKGSSWDVSIPLNGLFEEMIVLVLLPGIQQDDPNMVPFLLESPESRFRFKRLLQLTLHRGLLSETSQHEVSTHKCFIELLEVLLSQENQTSNVHGAVGDFSRQQLFSDKCEPIIHTNQSLTTPPFQNLCTTIDLMSSYRYFLLFVISSRPIPANAADLREKCISAEKRQRSGLVFSLMLRFIRQNQLLVRFVKEVMTVPLLSWKISVDARQIFVGATSKSESTPVFLSAIKIWVDQNRSEIIQGEMDNLLQLGDVTLNACPATAAQRLLANSVTFGMLCPAVNGYNPLSVDYEASAYFYDYLGVLLNHVPLATLSSRESAVEWVAAKDGQKRPIVLSSVIIDQCKALLADSVVRRLFYCAIDEEFLGTESILACKNDKDLKHENDFNDAGSTSASRLAAKEARIDRSKKFWNASKWAKRLTKGVSNLVSGDKAIGPSIDRSPTKSINNESARSPGYNPELLFSLSRLIAIVLGRWGGHGTSKHNTSQKRASSTQEQFTVPLLNTLCFSTTLLRATWSIIQSDPAVVTSIYGIIDPKKTSQQIRNLRITSSVIQPSVKGRSESDGAVFLYVFSAALAHTLIVIDDIELHDMDRPLPLHQMRRAIQVFKKLLFRASCYDDQVSTIADYLGLSLLSSTARAMRDLYDRSSRKPFCVPKFWVVADLMEEELKKCKTFAEYSALLLHPVFKLCPFLVPFKRRLKIFERLVTTNRIEIQGENSANPFHNNPLKPGIPVRITRGRLLEDGLLTMNRLGRNMRKRIAVQYVNEAGVRETGIDVGGLFKDFWTDLCAIAFDPNYALFRVTEDEHACMYPNPSSSSAHGSDHIILFEFLGRILGKALYEGITIHPRFAHFFLSFLRGDYNYLHMLADLHSVDAQLYNNLMFLKNYNGDVADLSLTFTVVAEDFGGSKEIPLIPNGSKIDVTSSNKHRYIGLVAKYYVVDRLKDQAEAFTRGLWDVIDRGWLQLFNEPELQVLISGSSEDKIDVPDMRSHTRYTGGFTAIDRSVGRFWKVFESFDSKQQSELLRFVTGCERPPPLGFASMNPPFTIQRVGIFRDGDKLPSASTCFNILKLPTYSSERVMRERLLFAIQSGAGFELS